MPKPVQIGAATLFHGDCCAVMAGLGPVDAIVTDPPYHLIQSSRGGSPRQNNLATPFGRTGSQGGFMGQRWDGGDIAFRPETWAKMFPVLKAGGYLLAFGGTRTHYRIWCAIEDAGFVIQDTIMWLYGQGFPKGKTQLKPAFEPIVVAYKPGGKRTLQIDANRVAVTHPGDYVDAPGDRGQAGRRRSSGYALSAGKLSPIGRWPANVCHDGSDEVMAAFAGTGQSRVGFRSERSRSVEVSGTNWWVNNHQSKEYPGDGPGTAARFFYCAKANKADRAGSKHPTIKPVALMRWLVALVTPLGGTVIDPFAGSGPTGQAALESGRRAILIECEADYIADIKRRLKAVDTHSVAG